MIRFERVTKTFGTGPTRVSAVNDFSLDIAAGEFCTFMGPSGSGKSTLLHLTAGFTPITNGEIYLDGRPISGLDRDAFWRRRDTHLAPADDAV